MAKTKANKASEATEAPAEGAEATTEAKAAEPRGIFITNENGEQERRLDLIRRLWATGEYTRGEITRKVNELAGSDIPYQIVFSATKGLPGKVAEKKPKAEKKAKGKAADTATTGEAEAA